MNSQRGISCTSTFLSIIFALCLPPEHAGMVSIQCSPEGETKDIQKSLLSSLKLSSVCSGSLALSTK